jgi:ATP-dependent protease ClpP protease subunit
MNEIQPYYRFRAEAGDEPASAELLIFDVIGNWEDIGEVGAKAFARDLSALPKSVKRLDIHINSPGGSVSEAQAIYSRLADHPSNKIVYVDGIAASAASIVAMVGHKIYIRSNANMMIHSPMAIAIGNADDMRTVISALESIEESMLNVYAKRSGMERDEIRSLMAAETWFSPQQAVDKGFADEVRGVVKAAAMVGNNKAVFNGTEFDLSRFHNVPAFTGQLERATMPKATKPKADQTPPAEDELTPPTAPETETPPTQPKPPPPPPPPPTAAAPSDYDRGVQEERARVSALQKLDRPATHAIIAKAITEGKAVADITQELFDAMEKAQSHSARRQDASALDNIPPTDGADDIADQMAGKLKSAVKARLKARGQRSVLQSRN